MKVIFDFSAQKIGIEGDGPELIKVLQAVRDLAPTLSEISISTAPERRHVVFPDQSPSQAKTQNGMAVAAPLSGQTIKQFVRGLRLKNASERIAAIAYYEKHYEGKEEFSAKDMEGWFSICTIPKPSQMPVAFFDAKRHHGYLENTGHGRWKLTNNGEKLVIGKLNQAEFPEHVS